MTTADRKKIVANLLFRSGQAAQKEIEAIESEQDPSLEFIYEHLKKYILLKFLLSKSCPEDDIKELAALSLARSLKLDKDLIRELDKATPCNNATSESVKKVLLLYSIQRNLKIKLDPAKLADTATVAELAALVHFQLQQAAKERHVVSKPPCGT